MLQSFYSDPKLPAYAIANSFCPDHSTSAASPYGLASGLATLQHGYHSDSTATIPAAASSSSLANAHNYESADGVAYRGLTALASLSLAVSVCVIG